MKPTLHQTPNSNKSCYHRSTIIHVLFLCLIIVSCENSRDGKTTTGNKSIQNENPFNVYLSQKKLESDTLSENSKASRTEGLSKLASNPLYDSLVRKKIVDQRYLFILQFIGEIIINESNYQSSLPVDKIEKLKQVDGALPFVLNVVRVDMFGGIPNEILEVYNRYSNLYGISGLKGSLISDLNGRQVEISQDFTLVEALTIFKYKYPYILNSFYEAHTNGLINWTEEDRNYKYWYLRSAKAFNKYLGDMLPESKYYIKYDYEISAADLYAAYNENEVAADEKYKDKKLLLTGLVKSVNKDVMGNCYALLSANGWLEDIHCEIPNEKAASKLIKGDRYTFLGTCSGMVLTSVIVSNCTVHTD